MRADADDRTVARALPAPAAPPRRSDLHFPTLMPQLTDRASALRARIGVLVSLYVLVPVPLVTDWIENGKLPESPRGWVTEVC